MSESVTPEQYADLIMELLSPGVTEEKYDLLIRTLSREGLAFSTVAVLAAVASALVVKMSDANRSDLRDKIIGSVQIIDSAEASDPDAAS